MQKSAIFLMGPTASGKTALAMQVADRLPVDLISVDSALVYRGMDIGTNKPTRAELAHIPQHLIDICDPSDAYSVARFCVDAKALMEKSWQQGRTPLLVGGTMLYFNALQFGLSPLPSADNELRIQIMQEGNMHARLAELDPLTAERLNPHDTQRLQRALEINILTGKTLQENFNAQEQTKLDCNIQSFAIVPTDRAALHVQIATRFNAMLAAGLVSEVEQLFNRNDLHENLPAIRSVGYRQVWAYLANKISYQQMNEQAIAATRQLAKRQYTWLRSWPDVITMENSNTEALDTIINSVLHSKTI